MISGSFLFYLNKPRNLNVILITLDALRSDHLGCYGYQRNTSPFLDLFSKNAFIFSDVISQSASTVPSMSSLFTSKYPYTDSLLDFSYALRDKHITVAEFLREKEYNTIAIVGHYYLAKKYGFHRGFNYFDDNFYALRTADEMQELAVSLLKKIDKNKKFFLWMHFREPHSPYTPPDKYKELFFEPFAGQDGDKICTIYGQRRLLSSKEIHELIIAYDANIRFVDDNLRSLFEYLGRENLIKKSIIIITADHGESLGEHNIFDHNELYYGILHIPLIIKIPYTKSGIITYPVSVLDIFPTILDLLNYKDSALKLDLKGKSIFLKRDKNEIQFSEYPSRYSIIENNWRLFLNKDGNYELYNIKTDPQELNNLISIEKEQFALLKQKLDEYLRRSSYQNKPTKPILDSQSEEKLKALGYVQ